MEAEDSTEVKELGRSVLKLAQGLAPAGVSLTWEVAS